VQLVGADAYRAGLTREDLAFLAGKLDAALSGLESKG
jgi:hypothetical protein